MKLTKDHTLHTLQVELVASGEDINGLSWDSDTEELRAHKDGVDVALSNRAEAVIAAHIPEVDPRVAKVEAAFPDPTQAAVVKELMGF
jgi:hypothetical protein